MEITLLALILAVPTALGFAVFRALASGRPGIAGRPLMATFGTTALFAPVLAYHYHGGLFSLAVMALAAFFYFAGCALRAARAGAAA
jgi:uncharacterized membrane protein